MAKTPRRKLENNYVSKKVTEFEREILPIQQFVLKDKSRQPSEDQIDRLLRDFFQTRFLRYDSEKTEAQFYNRIKANIEAARNLDLKEVNRKNPDSLKYKERVILRKIDSSIEYRAERAAKGKPIRLSGEIEYFQTAMPYFEMKSGNFIARMQDASQGGSEENPPATGFVIIDKVLKGTEENPVTYLFGPEEIEAATRKAIEIQNAIRNISDRSRKKAKEGEGGQGGQGGQEEPAADFNPSAAKFSTQIEEDDDGEGAIYTIEFHV